MKKSKVKSFCSLFVSTFHFACNYVINTFYLLSVLFLFFFKDKFVEFEGNFSSKRIHQGLNPFILHVKGFRNYESQTISSCFK